MKKSERIGLFVIILAVILVIVLLWLLNQPPEITYAKEAIEVGHKHPPINVWLYTWAFALLKNRSPYKK